MSIEPARLLTDNWRMLTVANIQGPILDLACGDGRNGIFLAQKGLKVICSDRSHEALNRARVLAARCLVDVETWKVDLEEKGINPLPQDFYGAILIFRYLHRPLIPFVKKALKVTGILIYETFTIGQPKFGEPHNPNYLLKPGELLGWFKDWHVTHYFEGIKQDPQRAVAQIICQKPGPQ